MKQQTLTEYLEYWAEIKPDQDWLKDIRGRETESYTWKDAVNQIESVAWALEDRFGNGNNILLLSENRAHWVLSELAIIRSGNTSVGLFTTLSEEITSYIREFTQSSVIFIGNSENWVAIKDAFPEDTTFVTLPDVELDSTFLGNDKVITWNSLLMEGKGRKPTFVNKRSDVTSLVFTSGTTGLPKGVIQTHDTSLVPINRSRKLLGLRAQPRYFSYLPLSHLAERQLVEYASIREGGEIWFNENVEKLLEDLRLSKPNFFFGVPRVWEQLQQGILAKFGGIESFETVLKSEAVTPEQIRDSLGLSDVDFCLTGSAPTPRGLTQWWENIGISLMDGYGQTEAMGLITSYQGCRRSGSVGKPIGDVEYRLLENNELVVKAPGLTPGYYRQPEKTQELYQGGWLHTGDTARVDKDGFIYITGRVKEYFKTIQGKFVAPPPIEDLFGENLLVEQQCLLGRGCSKTVMVATLPKSSVEMDPHELEISIMSTVEVINGNVEKHARVGAVILTPDIWTIENEMLTPTMKIRRQNVEERFGDLAMKLARQSAEEKRILVQKVS